MRFVPTLLLLAPLAAMIGCGSDPATESTPPEASGQSPTPASTVAPTADVALEFVGQQFVEIPNLRYDGSHPITLEARVIAKDIVAGSSVVANFQSAGLGLEIYRDGNWAFVFHDGISYKLATSDKPVKLHQPVYLAGVFDGRNLKLFVDGKLQKNVATTSGRHRASRFSFMVGADPHTARPAEKHFIGIIDEVRISNSSRYEKNYEPAGLKADEKTLVLYHFDKGSGDTAEDASRNKRHGKIKGGDAWTHLDWSVTGKKYRKFLDLLIAAREKAGLTQAKLAEKISRPLPFIERLERGELKIDVVEFVEIANALGIDPGAFMKQLKK